MSSAGDSFGWAFRDPAWAGKVIVQGLIVLIPIVGWIAMCGWLRMAFENARAGRNELPPAGFHLARGIALFGVFAIYGIVLSLPGWILQAAGGGSSALHGLGFLLGFVGSLLLYFLVPSLIVNVHRGGFGGGMDVQRVWELASVNTNTSLTAAAIVLVASIIGWLGVILCLVPAIFTVPYQNTIQASVAAWFERMHGDTSIREN